MVIGVLERDDLPFPLSLPEFQRLFPNEAACAAYLERARWSNGFICDHCGTPGEPYRFANRPGVCRCRHCNRDTSLAAGTVMKRTQPPLSVWFWAAYTWLPAKRPACRLCSSGGNSDCRVTRRLSRFSTNCGPAWCVSTRIGLVAIPENMSRPMKPTPEDVLAARTEVFTTWFSLPVRSRLNSESTVAASTSGRLGGTPDVFGSPWCQIEVPNHWAASLSASLRQALPSLPMTGAATRRLESECIFTPPLRNVTTCKLPRPSCPSFTSCSRISKHGYTAFTTATARNTCKPTSTNSRSDSTAASTHLTLSAPCLALLATSLRRPMLSFMPKNHCPLLHLVALGANRIST
jgi:hypothetical protein